MISISFQKKILQNLPGIRLGCISMEVQVVPSGEEILAFSEKIISNISLNMSIEDVSTKSTIKDTKDAYRRLGKDPSRYRPSAEALTRRIINGKGLYLINNIVDILNLVSLESGFSIGGYDFEKIKGNIEFGVGEENESYIAIGRGKLNIKNLPLFRDESGAFGSPTSDSLRTMVTNSTSRFLMIIIDFGKDDKLKDTINRTTELYKKYTNTTGFETALITASN